MNQFDFCSPTRFVFGKEREREAGAYVKRYGGSRVLVHFGGESAKKSGLLDRVTASLEQEQIDFILAIGGGSVIDSAKAIAMGAVYDGDFWDFYSGKSVAKDAIPVGTVLTIAAAGSEGSGDSVITHEDGDYKRGASSDFIRPKFSILNPELTQTLPAYQTACGATDIMAHVFERYFTNTKEVEITDRLCEGILLSMLYEVPRAVADPDNYDARANIMWAGMVAHNNIVGVGREQDWNSHAIEHELSALYDVAHGAGLAVIMPAWMSYVVELHDPMRMAQMAVRVFGCEMNFDNPKETAKQGIRAFRRFLASIGMPINFSQLGARKEDIPLLVEKFGIGEGKTGGYVALDYQAVTEIYELAAEAVL